MITKFCIKSSFSENANSIYLFKKIFPSVFNIILTYIYHGLFLNGINFSSDISWQFRISSSVLWRSDTKLSWNIGGKLFTIEKEGMEKCRCALSAHLYFAFFFKNINITIWNIAIRTLEIYQTMKSNMKSISLRTRFLEHLNFELALKKVFQGWKLQIKFLNHGFSPAW